MIAIAHGATTAPEPGLLDQLLRDRPAMLARIAAGRDPLAILRAMTATIAVCMVIVGAALGSYRGGIQIAFAAIKLPLVLLGTAALSAPTLTAIGAALGRPARLATDAALVMTALAFGALLLAACTPLILLARAVALPYHATILSAVAMFAVAWLASLRVIANAVGRQRGAIAIMGFALVFAAVGAQLGWSLRPYIVRPRATGLVFLRARAESLYDALSTSVSSARGVYGRDRAPLPGDQDSTGPALPDRAALPPGSAEGSSTGPALPDRAALPPGSAEGSSTGPALPDRAALPPGSAEGSSTGPALPDRAALPPGSAEDRSTGPALPDRAALPPGSAEDRSTGPALPARAALPPGSAEAE